MAPPFLQYPCAPGAAVPLDDFVFFAERDSKNATGGNSSPSLDRLGSIEAHYASTLESAQSEPPHPTLDAAESEASPEGLATPAHPAPKGSKRKRDSINTASSSGSTTPGISHSHGLTPAEKRREQKLQNDSLAIVLSPQVVQCKRCESMIKLSVKSAYDALHWVKHRERCLKRSDAVVRNIKEDAGKQRQKPSWPSEVQIRTAPKRRRVESSVTPSLADDESNDSDDRASEHTLKEEEPAPAPVAVYVRALDPEFEEYLVRSHRRPTQDFLPLEDWKTWSWAQLKRPVWGTVVRAERGEDSEDSSTTGILKGDEQD
ncbi:hypothetical protein B0H21DRAFT_357495 [Amylocystis lapponica]|nr:hypothetical protein B0H21DRAFT_357495 [Amylocystis lapponica]